jgi:hypothetical protein
MSDSTGSPRQLKLFEFAYSGKLYLLVVFFQFKVRIWVERQDLLSNFFQSFVSELSKQLEAGNQQCKAQR